MIKCRQGGAAAGPKFIIVLGRMSAECESEGGLQEGGEEGRREEREGKESQMDATRGMRNLGRSLSSQTTAEFSGAWQLHTCVIPQNRRARDSPMNSGPGSDEVKLEACDEARDTRTSRAPTSVTPPPHPHLELCATYWRTQGDTHTHARTAGGQLYSVDMITVKLQVF